MSTPSENNSFWLSMPKRASVTEPTVVEGLTITPGSSLQVRNVRVLLLAIWGGIVGFVTPLSNWAHTLQQLQATHDRLRPRMPLWGDPVFRAGWERSTGDCLGLLLFAFLLAWSLSYLLPARGVATFGPYGIITIGRWSGHIASLEVCRPRLRWKWASSYGLRIHVDPEDRRFWLGSLCYTFRNGENADRVAAMLSDATGVPLTHPD
jgi:hypothetical protein